jgi:hypothetical protein
MVDICHNKLAHVKFYFIVLFLNKGKIGLKMLSPFHRLLEIDITDHNLWGSNVMVSGGLLMQRRERATTFKKNYLLLKELMTCHVSIGWV